MHREKHVGCGGADSDRNTEPGGQGDKDGIDELDHIKATKMTKAP